MVDAKHLADAVTFLRGFLAFFLAWLGIYMGKPGLTLAVITMILCWTGDFVDGKIARLNRTPRKTWIGDHDVHVDVFVSLGLGVYLVGAAYVSRWVAFLYIIFWAFMFWKFGLERNLLMLFQAPIYGTFIVISLYEVPSFGRWILLWILMALTINWRKFSGEVVPGFIHGMLNLLRNHDHTKTT